MDAIVSVICDNLSPILVGVVVFLVAHAILQNQHSSHGYPPGPFCLPILNNLPQVAYYGSLPALSEQCRKKYGNIFTIKIGADRNVIGCGYDNMHYLLVKNADATSNRAYKALGKIMSAEEPGILWAPHPDWKILRSFALNILREEGMGKQNLEPKVLDEVNQFCRYFIQPNLTKAVNLEGFQKATCNVISELIFGGRYDYEDPEYNEFVAAMDHAIDAVMKANYLYLRSLKLIKFPKHVIVPKFKKQLEEHRATLNSGSNMSKDILSEYLIHKEDKGGDYITCLNDGNAIPVSMAVQLYIAGTETTSTALRWAFLYTCLYPEVKNKVCLEIEEHIGFGRLVRWTDRLNMPYTEAVLLETLRIANIVPMALPRTLNKQMVVDGKVIPARTDLMLHMASVLHDEAVFEDPKIFKPERYLFGDTKFKKQRTIPFSIGKRDCLGESWAKMEFFLFYVALLQRYDVRPIDDYTTPSTEPIVKLVSAPQPFKVIFTARS